MKSNKLLHFYGQHQPHQEAWVCGNKEGLIALRDLLDEAINKCSGSCVTQGASLELTSSDGEDYKVLALCLSDSYMEKLILPYTNETYLPAVSDKLVPFQLIGRDLYRKLMGSK